VETDIAETGIARYPKLPPDLVETDIAETGIAQQKVEQKAVLETGIARYPKLLTDIAVAELLTDIAELLTDIAELLTDIAEQKVQGEHIVGVDAEELAAEVRTWRGQCRRCPMRPMWPTWRRQCRRCPMRPTWRLRCSPR